MLDATEWISPAFARRSQPKAFEGGAVGLQQLTFRQAAEVHLTTSEWGPIRRLGDQTRECERSEARDLEKLIEAGDQIQD